MESRVVFFFFSWEPPLLVAIEVDVYIYGKFDGMPEDESA